MTDSTVSAWGKIIEELKDNITFFSPDEPTCALFTGHIGCGKSTELLRLKAELEADGFHVVYFESSEDLEMADVDIVDVLLAIARRISQSLQTVQLGKLTGLQTLVQGAARVLNAEVQGVRIKVPNLGDVGVVSQNDTVSLAFGIGEITAKTKSDATMRQRLNQYLGPQKTQLLQVINQELIEPAKAGKAMVKVKPHNTSQVCSCCNRLVEKDLSIRIHECLCGLILDRDWNAAINIKRVGLGIFPTIKRPKRSRKATTKEAYTVIFDSV
ncbi:MAG: zinc ribbon domain-containing protein [Coleofasciculus sp. D1-CHI-01]